jgi:hypothetical protein
MRQPESELSQGYFPEYRVKKATLSPLSFHHIVGTPERIELGALSAQLRDLGADFRIVQDGFAITTKFGNDAVCSQRPFRDKVSRLRV